MGRFLVDVTVMVICGVMIWPEGRVQGRHKDAIVRAMSCPEGELSLNALFALALRVL